MSAEARATKDVAADIVRELWLHTPRAKEEWDSAIRSVTATLVAFAAEQTARATKNVDTQDALDALELWQKRTERAEAQVERLRAQAEAIKKRYTPDPKFPGSSITVYVYTDVVALCDALLAASVPPSGEPRP